MTPLLSESRTANQPITGPRRNGIYLYRGLHVYYCCNTEGAPVCQKIITKEQ